MYKKVHHKLKTAHQHGLAWRDPFPKTEKQKETGLNVRVSERSVASEFPAFPIVALPSREGAQLEAVLLGVQPEGPVGVPGLVSTSQFIFHSFLVIIFLEVRLLRFL